MTTSNYSAAAIAGAGAIFGILLANVFTDLLSSQPYWLRVSVSAVTGGTLAAVFVFVASRFFRR
jgi:hypothetical protein